MSKEDIPEKQEWFIIGNNFNPSINAISYLPLSDHTSSRSR